MTAVLMIVSLIGASLSIAFGVVRLGTWLIQLREHHAARAIREAAAIAQARAEFLPPPSRLRHLEIESTKRGDLLASAIYAEQSEGFHG